MVSPVRFVERGDVVARVRASFRPSTRISVSLRGVSIDSVISRVGYFPMINPFIKDNIPTELPKYPGSITG